MKKTIKIAVANHKGGIGKTTTALSLASNLQKRGYKVLFVDTDAQRNSTYVYRAQIENVATLADILYSATPVKNIVQHTDLGDIIAGDSQLQSADTTVKPGPLMYTHLKNAIEPFEKEYDFIIFDTPPRTGVVLGNVLFYTEYIIIPITCDSFGVQGVLDFYDTISEYKTVNRDLSILGLLNIKYKGRETLTKDVEDHVQPDIAEKIGTKIFKTKIRESVKCREAQTMRVFLDDYAPACTTARDYYDFTEEVLKEVL